MIHAVEIKLANGKGAALVDVSDLALVQTHSWYNAKGYATAAVVVSGKRRTISMHRIILGAPSGVEVDHINGDRLDNRRANLRLVTRADNMKNKRAYGGSSVYKGVHLRRGRWVAQIQIDMRQLHIGQFDTELDAAWHYNREAMSLFGEYARLNDIGPYVPTTIKKGKRARKSRYRHVSWHKNNKKFAVVMAIDGRNRFLAQFSDEDEAGLFAIKRCRARGGACC